jgi:hypothetical protein
MPHQFVSQFLRGWARLTRLIPIAEFIRSSVRALVGAVARCGNLWQISVRYTRAVLKTAAWAEGILPNAPLAKGRSDS